MHILIITISILAILFIGVPLGWLITLWIVEKGNENDII